MLKRLFLFLMLFSAVGFAIPGCGGSVPDSVSTDEVEEEDELTEEEEAGEAAAAAEGEEY